MEEVKEKKKSPKKKPETLANLNAAMYKPNQIGDKKDIAREKETASGALKTKTIERVTYKNGVIKNRLKSVVKTSAAV